MNIELTDREVELIKDVLQGRKIENWNAQQAVIEKLARQQSFKPFTPQEAREVGEYIASIIPEKNPRTAKRHSTMSTTCPKGLRENLRDIRKLRGLTQSQLAILSTLKPATISHFETGERTPTIQNLLKISVALEVTLDELVIYGKR